MRFQSLSGSECMFVRTIAASILSWTVLNPTPVVMTQSILQQNPVYADTLLAFGFDALPGCPLGPMAITDYQKAKTAISIFPNPSSGKFTIEHTENANEHSMMSLEIYNSVGEKIFQTEISEIKSEIDLSDQPNGIYFVSIKTEKELFTEKIIIQK
jgi:hypothetical protein